MVPPEQTVPKLRRRLASLVVGAALAATLAACGAKQSALEEPHIGGERFTRVTWEGLPRPAGSNQKCYAPTDGGKSEVRTIQDTTVDEQQAWYDRQLTEDGWTKKTGPEQTVDGTLVTYDRLGRSVALTFAAQAGTLACEDASASGGASGGSSSGGGGSATPPAPGGPIEVKIVYTQLQRPGG